MRRSERLRQKNAKLIEAVLSNIGDGNNSEVEDCTEDDIEARDSSNLSEIREDNTVALNDVESTMQKGCKRNKHNTKIYVENNLTPPDQVRWTRCNFESIEENIERQSSVSNASHETNLRHNLNKPITFFENYIDDNLLKLAVQCTNHYAKSKATKRWTDTNINEMKQFFGIHILMGIYKFPRIEMYWESHASIPFIIETMSLHRFYQLRSAVHFTLETDTNPNDRFWKIRPIFDAVRQGCLKLKTGTKFSIDEQMIPYRGKLDVKQYIRNKPIKWGVKVFALCDASGVLYDFLLYQGKKTELEPNYLQFGQGAAVVMQLSERIEEPRSQLFFDNYFSTLHLFEWLKNKKIDAAGTVRLNRFYKPPFTTDKQIKKNEDRGYSENVACKNSGVILTKWFDSSCVNVGSNYLGVGKEDECERWDKQKKEMLHVKRPEVIREYNKNMGGVDHFDWYLSLYRIYVRSRKWTLRMIVHAFDMSLVNSWLEYRRKARELGYEETDILDLLKFRLQISDSLMTLSKPKKRGRPRSDVTVVEEEPKKKRKFMQKSPVKRIIQDKTNHLPLFLDLKNPQRCKHKDCKGKTFIYCGKCKVSLCVSRKSNCFKDFHNVE